MRLYHNLKGVACEYCTLKLSIKINLIEHPFDNKYLLVKLKERKSWSITHSIFVLKFRQSIFEIMKNRTKSHLPGTCGKWRMVGLEQCFQPFFGSWHPLSLKKIGGTLPILKMASYLVNHHLKGSNSTFYGAIVCRTPGPRWELLG